MHTKKRALGRHERYCCSAVIKRDALARQPEQLKPLTKLSVSHKVLPTVPATIYEPCALAKRCQSARRALIDAPVCAIAVTTKTPSVQNQSLARLSLISESNNKQSRRSANLIAVPKINDKNRYSLARWRDAHSSWLSRMHSHEFQVANPFSPVSTTARRPVGLFSGTTRARNKPTRLAQKCKQFGAHKHLSAFRLA